MKVRGHLINLQRYSPNMTRPTNKLNVTVMYVENFWKENMFNSDFFGNSKSHSPSPVF